MDKYVNFNHKTKKWYLKNKRDLPWRYNNPDPYRIWLSEIIMQQTKIAQGTNYYNKFIDAYPSIIDLGNAAEDEILKLWQGLGYYSRARNLHKTAKFISEKHNGIFPKEYEEILQLKGVGQYTASAIASIAFNTPKAAVDGNVYRVLSRFFGISSPIDSANGKKEYQRLADKLLDRKKPGDYNQAVMEFGALQCIPRNPNCTDCPLKEECFAFQNDHIHFLPVKLKKTKQKNRYFSYLVIEQGDSIFLKKRDEKDIWHNLYDFPLIESKKPLALRSIESAIEEMEIFPKTAANINHITSDAHVLSHQKIFASFTRLSIPADSKVNFPKAFPVNKYRLKEYAVPKLLENYLLNESDLLHLL